MQNIEKQIVVDGGHEYDGFRMRDALYLGPTSPTTIHAKVPAMMVITHSHDDHYSGEERLISSRKLSGGKSMTPLIQIGSEFAVHFLLLLPAFYLSIICSNDRLFSRSCIFCLYSRHTGKL